MSGEMVINSHSLTVMAYGINRTVTNFHHRQLNI